MSLRDDGDQVTDDAGVDRLGTAVHLASDASAYHCGDSIVGYMFF